MAMNPVIQTPSYRTFREIGIDRARALLNTSNFEEFHDPLLKYNAYLDVTNSLVSSGTVTDLNATNVVDGGGLRCNTAASSGSKARVGLPNFQVAAMLSTSGWFIRCRLKPNTAIASKQKFSLSMSSGSVKADVEIGAIGSGVTGGSATKFSMVKVDSGNTQRAGATSTISLDTSSHVFELWHPVADTNFYGSVDLEAALTVGNQDCGGTTAQLMMGAECGTDAAVYTCDIYEYQVIIVRP